MKKALKWIGIGLAALILIAVGLGIAGGQQLRKTHDIQAEAITISTDCDTSYPLRHFDSNIKGDNWRKICIRKQRKN